MTILSGSLNAQTDGNVIFSVLTVSNGATYSPKHVLSIWVKDSQGNFIVSREVKANYQKRHLVKWSENSQQNSINAITGATLPDHVEHIVSWDCRDFSGNLVPDGTYEIWVEYTSRNSAGGGEPGPSTKVLFTKGTSAVSLTPDDADYFVNMSLCYTPQNISAGHELPPALNFKAFPMPFTSKMNIELSLPEATYINVSVYNLNGQRVKELVNTVLPQGANTITWNGQNSTGSSIPQGTYFLRITYQGKVYTHKIIRMKP